MAPELARVDEAVASGTTDNAHAAAALQLVRQARDHVESLGTRTRTTLGEWIFEAEVLARGIRLVAATELAQEAAVSRMQQEMNDAFESTFFEIERIAARVHKALGLVEPAQPEAVGGTRPATARPEPGPGTGKARATEQLELLRIDELYGAAIGAGDMQRAELCYRALQGDSEARETCRQALALAAAGAEPETEKPAAADAQQG